MQTQNLQMSKKASHQRKSTLITFDMDLEGEYETDSSIIHQKLKRQQNMVEDERHQKMIKKPKIDDHFQYQIQKPISGTNRYSQLGDESATHVSHKRQPKIQEDPKILQQKSLQLLKQLLFHPAKKQSALINPEIANKWILDESTPTRIKSFLALYMILHHFDSMQFAFVKTINLEGQPFKHIQIKKAGNKIIVDDKDIQDDNIYKRFKLNETKRYLASYLEWLIWKNQHIFEITPNDFEFWAMALNNCEQAAMKLLRSKNQRQSANNILMSSFLMNAQDFVFRSTSQTPKSSIIMHMKNEDMSRLPVCHWLLAVNFSVRYFYQKDLNVRVAESLEAMEIETEELDEFYHEYQLLASYFSNKTLPFKGSILSDSILEWLAMNSGCREGRRENDKDLRQNVVRGICSSLLNKALESKHDKEVMQEKMLVSVELLQRDSLLSEDQKNNVLSSILYKEAKIAYKLGKEFPSAINQLQHKRQTTLPHLFQRIAQQYSELYSHLILSEHPGTQNDLLAQLKNLASITFKMQTPQVIGRILKIVASFNLLTHWNKDVLKSFVFILDHYLQKFDEFIQSKIEEKHKKDDKMEIEGKQSQKNSKLREKQRDQLKNLHSFLKIHLNLEAMNIENLTQILTLIKSAQNAQSELPLEPRTISFMKKNLLSILFAKNGFNQSMLSEIKKDFSSKKHKNSERINDQGSTEKNTILDELKTVAQGMRYFEEQIDLLMKEAQYI